MRKYKRIWNLHRQDYGLLLSRCPKSSFADKKPSSKRSQRLRRTSQPQRIDDTLLRQLLAHTYDIVIILDADGTTQYQSPAAERLLGYMAKDVIGTNGFNFVHPDDRPHLLVTFAALLAEPGSSCSAKMRVLHSNGSWRNLEGTATNLLQDATVAGVVINCHDITELEATKNAWHDAEQLAAQQYAEVMQCLESQRRWVSDVTHELKSPLTVIRARLEIAFVHPELTNWPTLISEVLDEVGQLRRLIDEIHELAYIDERGVEAYIGHRSKIDLKAVVLAATRVLSDQRLQTDHVSTAWVYGNADHLRRIIRNLLDNAIRYAQTVIQISLATAHDHVVLQVEDDGPGIPESERDRIFQRFSHVGRDRDRMRHGPGLGLAIVRTLVLQYGGEVTVSDSSLGGAKFEVTFPAAKE